MLEPSNPATAPAELFRQLTDTARRVEVPWSPLRAQGIMRGVERQRRLRQRRRALLPMLCAACLVIVMASWASWAAWSQRGSPWTWPWSSTHSTVIPQAPREPEAPQRKHGSARPVSSQALSLPLPVVEEEETAEVLAQVPPLRGVAKPTPKPRPVERTRVAAAATPPPPPPASQGTEEKPTWQELAHEGQFEQAYTVAYGAAESPTHAAPQSPVAGASDLLLLADVARLSRHPADAVSPLTRLLGNHATDPRAPLAAFTLGRVLLDDLGRPREAADAFRRVQTLELQGPDGPLAQDALAREVEAWSRAGEPQRARERAQEYVRHYPTGRRLRSVRHFGELD